MWLMKPMRQTISSPSHRIKFTKSQDVEYNGYVGDKPLTTYAHEIITGDIFYTYGDSYYSNKLYPADTYTVNHDISLPAGL